MLTIRDLDDNLLIEIFIGLLIMVFLLVFMGPPEFYTWAVYTFIGYAASVFFIMPMALGIIERRFPKEYIVLTVIGGAILFVYAVVLGKAWNEIFVDILQTAVVITVLSAFFSVLKKTLERKIPPPWRKKQ